MQAKRGERQSINEFIHSVATRKADFTVVLRRLFKIPGRFNSDSRTRL